MSGPTAPEAPPDDSAAVSSAMAMRFSIISMAAPISAAPGSPGCTNDACARHASHMSTCTTAAKQVQGGHTARHTSSTTACRVS